MHGILRPQNTNKSIVPRFFVPNHQLLINLGQLKKETIMKIQPKLFVITLVALLASSCASMRSKFIPYAINTVNSVNLSELNLEREDYEILNTVTATAIIQRTGNRKSYQEYTLSEQTGELTYYRTIKKGMIDESVEGVVYAGFLSNDFANLSVDVSNPASLARAIAIYRIINQVQANGADGVIEPIVSTSYSNGLYKTTVSAKLIKLKID